MSLEDSCLPEIGADKKRRRPILLIIFVVVGGLAYSPAMLAGGVPMEVVVVTAPAVVGLVVEVVRRTVAHAWPSTPDASAASSSDASAAPA
jgi:hypothetical protein